MQRALTPSKIDSFAIVKKICSPQIGPVCRSSLRARWCSWLLCKRPLSTTPAQRWWCFQTPLKPVQIELSSVCLLFREVNNARGLDFLSILLRLFDRSSGTTVLEQCLLCIRLANFCLNPKLQFTLGSSRIDRQRRGFVHKDRLLQVNRVEMAAISRMPTACVAHNTSALSC